MPTSDRAPVFRSDRNVALANYGLLLASIVFAGLPGLAAVVIAYQHRMTVEPAIRRHFEFQIVIFWVAVGLSSLAAGCTLAALITGLTDLLAFSAQGGWKALQADAIALTEVNLDRSVLIWLGSSLMAFVLTLTWLICAPIFGFIRLANRRDLGQTKS